jgi:hypothetical protein
MSEDVNSQLSQLTGARQTMSSWSKVIESYDAVPDIYKDFLKSYAEAGQAFPYAILSPSLEKFLHKSTEKLTYDANDAINILERSGKRVSAKSYPYKNIQSLEIGNVLLSSWITISGVTSEGVSGSSTIDFNAATGERHFARFLSKIRPQPLNISEGLWKTEKDKFDGLAESNFKFMNYGRSSLVPGEKVVQLIYQPEIREPARELAGWTVYKSISMPHLTILTDKELILIRDDDRVKEVKGVRYGGVWQYIPLNKIRSAKLTEVTNNLLALVVTLPSGDAIKKLFRISSKAELEQFHDKIKELTG